MNKVINFLENQSVIERREGKVTYDLGELYKVVVWDFGNEEYTVVVRYKDSGKTVDTYNINKNSSEGHLDFVLNMLEKQSESKPEFEFTTYTEDEIDEILENDINGFSRLDKKLHMNLIYSILTQNLDRKKYWKILDNPFSTLDKFLEYEVEDVNNYESIYKFKLPNGTIIMNENVSSARVQDYGVDGAEYHLLYQSY